MPQRHSVTLFHRPGGEGQLPDQYFGRTVSCANDYETGAMGHFLGSKSLSHQFFSSPTQNSFPPNRLKWYEIKLEALQIGHITCLSRMYFTSTLYLSFHTSCGRGHIPLSIGTLDHYLPHLYSLPVGIILVDLDHTIGHVIKSKKGPVMDSVSCSCWVIS